MERLDQAPEEEHLKALIYGNPGTGKTSFGVTSPEPLILLSERQGYVHIRHAAARLGIPVPRVLLCTKAADYRNVLRALHALRSDSKGLVISETFTEKDPNDPKKTVERTREIERFDGWVPRTIVIDSVTEAMQLFADEIDRQSPPKLGKDGLPIRSDRYWGTLIDRCTKFVRGYRALPFHMLFLALMDDRIEGEGEESFRTATPMVATRKLGTVVAAAVNVVGITFRNQTRATDQSGDVVYEYGVTTRGKSWQMTKPLRPLRDEEVSDFASWVRRVHEGSAELPPAPAPAGDKSFDGDAPQEGKSEADAPPKTDEKPPEKPAEEKGEKPKTTRTRSRAAATGEV